MRVRALICSSSRNRVERSDPTKRFPYKWQKWDKKKKTVFIFTNENSLCPRASLLLHTRLPSTQLYIWSTKCMTCRTLVGLCAHGRVRARGKWYGTFLRTHHIQSHEWVMWMFGWQTMWHDDGVKCACSVGPLMRKWTHTYVGWATTLKWMDPGGLGFNPISFVWMQIRKENQMCFSAEQ